jgi:hypothetical protein
MCCQLVGKNGDSVYNRVTSGEESKNLRENAAFPEEEKLFQGDDLLPLKRRAG